MKKGDIMNINNKMKDFIYEYAEEIYDNYDDAELAYTFLCDAHHNFNFDIKHISCNLFDVNFEYFDEIVNDCLNLTTNECYLTKEALRAFYVKIINEEISNWSCTASLNNNNNHIIMSYTDFYYLNDCYKLTCNSLNELFEQFDYIFSDYDFVQEKIINFVLKNSYQFADSIEVSL